MFEEIEKERTIEKVQGWITSTAVSVPTAILTYKTVGPAMAAFDLFHSA